MTSQEYRAATLAPELYFGPAETQHQAELWNKRAKVGLPPHIYPGSTLIAAMGQHWHPGSKEAVLAMAQHSWQEGGILVRFYAEQDRCYEPYDGLGTMRNLAYMRAIREGFEWIMYVDNDILPEPDALMRLQEWQMPVIAPLVRYTDGEDHGIRQGSYPEGGGLLVVHSVLLSCLLMRTEVFLPWALTPFWDNARGSDEEVHFERLAMVGHRPIVDTNTIVRVQNPPHFPFDHIERTYAELAPAEAIQNWRMRKQAGDDHQ